MPSLQSGREVTLFAITLLLLILTIVFVFARLYAKHMKKLAWTPDDWLLLAALVMIQGQAAVCLLMVFLCHIGRHVWRVSPWELSMALKLIWFSQFPYAAAMTFARLSMTVLFLRIFFRHAFPKLRWTAYVCIVLSIIWGILFIILPLINCHPIRHIWIAPFQDIAYCIPIKSIKTAQIIVVSLGVLIDAVIWSLPHFVVWKLRLRRAHKMALTALFSLGILNVLIGIFRILSLAHLSLASDLPYNAVPTVLWALAQPSTAIILTCCPLLRPIFEIMLPKRLTRMRTAMTMSRGNFPTTAIQATTRVEVQNDSRPVVRRPAGLDFLDEGGEGLDEAPVVEVSAPIGPGTVQEPLFVIEGRRV